jgi:CRP-like cAMP-binding protein
VTGEPLIRSGTSLEALPLIVRGRVQVRRGEQVVGELGAGSYVGSALLLSGAPSDLDAVAMEPVRTMRWEVATLSRYLAANPDTRIAMQSHLARDLAGKLERMTRDSVRA